MILHQYPAVWGMNSLSPFCIKLETYFKIKKVDYEVKVELNPKRGPKGKMPFVTYNGEKIPDSSFIIKKLFPEDQLSLSDIAYKSLIEETLYFILLYSRWIDPEGYKVIRSEFYKLFPFKLGLLALPLIRRNLYKQADGYGISRHSLSEVYSMGKDGIIAISHRLGDRLYFCGSLAGQLDCIAFGFLQTVFRQPIESPLKKELLKYQNLVDFIYRIEKEFDMYHP
ncbi:MAG: hypothetical protein CL678_17200 [Bdellovibrionaceae bacterium]|nr:hypothetical protein [Pseudobdellovibrionaceae bacterium]|tara:strand:- start:3631 stop:4305 length:675 start_codon:yes stop_codon:yes gene_type:complete